MIGIDLLWTIFEWLPLVFAIDLLAFHATGDHPLALRWWWRRAAVHPAAASYAVSGCQSSSPARFIRSG